jgi:hypothetical protein
VLHFVKNKFEEALVLEVWNIGISRTPIHQVIAQNQAEPVRWLPESGPYHFRADPFLLPDGPGLKILCEDFDHATGRGVIAALTVSEDTLATRTEPAIDTGVHMSYPCLVRDGGQTYCIPETLASGGVPVFRAVELPTRWEPAGYLLKQFPAADPTVFRYQGRWWLFSTNGLEFGGIENLYAWFAEDLPGPWTSHSLNPLKSDARSSRPAGLPFLIEDVLYRPAQNCERGYGSSITINRIVSLSPTTFEEEAVARVAPDSRGPYPCGLHTISTFGGLTVIDGMRRRFVLDKGRILSRERERLRQREEKGRATPSVTRGLTGR